MPFYSNHNFINWRTSHRKMHFHFISIIYWWMICWIFSWWARERSVLWMHSCLVHCFHIWTMPLKSRLYAFRLFSKWMGTFFFYWDYFPKTEIVLFQRHKYASISCLLYESCINYRCISNMCHSIYWNMLHGAYASQYVCGVIKYWRIFEED